MKHLVYLIAFLLLCGFTGNPPATTFTKKEMGSAWPFKTIQAGTVRCAEGMYVILVATSGRVYALNGTAQSVARERGWNNLDGEQIVGKSIGPMLEAGLKLCKQ